MLQHPQAEVSKIHHVPLEEVPRNAPVLTVRRNPYEQALSWYYHAVVRHTKAPTPGDMLVFLETYRVPFLFDDRLNIYAEIADKEYPFEEGLEAVMYDLGLERYKVPVVGATHADDRLLTEEVRETVRARFPLDFNN